MTGSWRGWAATGCCVLACAAAGCSDPAAPAPDPAAGSTTSAPAAPVPELQPGAPGEDATTRDPGAPVEDGRPDEDDIAFMQMMVLHHRQALEMAGLVPDRAADERVQTAAARIESVQGAEILVMAQWLTDHAIDVPAPDADPADYDHAEHGHSGMEGLLTPDELDELADADGPAFDRLFVEGMIRHHGGAVLMARRVLAEGADPRVIELGTDVVTDQSAEIARLEALLAGL